MTPITAVPACTIGLWAFFSFEQDRPLSVWCFALGGQTLVGRLEGLLISQAGQRSCQTFSLLLSIALQHQFISYGPWLFPHKNCIENMSENLFLGRLKVWCSPAFCLPAPRLSGEHSVLHFQFPFKNNIFLWRLQLATYFSNGHYDLMSNVTQMKSRCVVGQGKIYVFGTGKKYATKNVRIWQRGKEMYWPGWLVGCNVWPLPFPPRSNRLVKKGTIPSLISKSILLHYCVWTKRVLKEMSM